MAAWRPKIVSTNPKETVLRTIVFNVLSAAFLMAVTGLAVGQTADKPDARGPVGPGLHARLFDAHLQPLLEVCDGKDQPIACINGLWDVADVSGDGELSVAEVTRILRVASGKAAHQSYVEDYLKFQAGLRNSAVPEPNEAVVVIGAATVGPVISHALIANFDYDDNGRLSKAEALNDVAADIVLSSLEDLPPELQSHASKAVGFLMQFLMKK